MTNFVRFDVIGIPAPQGSKTRMPNGAMVEGGSQTGRAKHKQWRTSVAEAAREQRDKLPGPLDGPLRLEVHFRFPRPASRPRRTAALTVPHSTKPDLSKLIRSTEDALTDAGLITDDARIYNVSASKHEVPAGEWVGAMVAIYVREVAA